MEGGQIGVEQAGVGQERLRVQLEPGEDDPVGVGAQQCGQLPDVEVLAPSGQLEQERPQRLLGEVFGEKPEVSLDVAHGSHKAEHDAQLRLGAARERIERVMTGMAGRRPEQDADGDYVVPASDVHVMVAPRVAAGGPVVVRVFAITNVGVSVTPELGLFLARLNFGLMFGRFALDAEHRSIWFDETLLGDQFSDEELRFAIQVVSSTADDWDDRLKQMFGGATYQEVLTSGANHELPRVKPGEGGYL